jgi:hypothetical protein
MDSAVSLEIHPDNYTKKAVGRQACSSFWPALHYGMLILHPTFTRVLRLRLKDKHARALRERAYWVNQVWNYCNDLSVKVLRREGRFLSGFDLQKYTNGCTKEGIPLHSQTGRHIR